MVRIPPSSTLVPNVDPNFGPPSSISRRLDFRPMTSPPVAMESPLFASERDEAGGVKVWLFEGGIVPFTVHFAEHFLIIVSFATGRFQVENQVFHVQAKLP